VYKSREEKERGMDMDMDMDMEIDKEKKMNKDAEKTKKDMEIVRLLLKAQDNLRNVTNQKEAHAYLHKKAVTRLGKRRWTECITIHGLDLNSYEYYKIKNRVGKALIRFFEHHAKSVERGEISGRSFSQKTSTFFGMNRTDWTNMRIMYGEILKYQGKEKDGEEERKVK
jgi:hypothetical protein